MKNSVLTKALLLASLPFASQSFAGGPPPVAGSVSQVTAALTISTTIPGLVLKDNAGKPIKGAEAGVTDRNEYTTGTGAAAVSTDERATKILVSKYTIKELLTDLKPMLDIESIAGWSIQKVQATVEGGEFGVDIGEVKFYAVKAGATASAPPARIVDLDDEISLDLLSRVDAAALKRTQKVETAPVITYSATLKQAGTLNINLGEDSFSLHGIYTGSQKLSFLGANKTPVILSGAAKIATLSGQLSDETIVEGTITISAGKAVANVSGYPNVVPVQEIVD